MPPGATLREAGQVYQMDDTCPMEKGSIIQTQPLLL